METRVLEIDGRTELIDGDRVLARGEVADAGARRDLRIEVLEGTDRAVAFARLLPSLLATASGAGDEPAEVRWWVTDPDGASDRLADQHGLAHRRDLFQLRRPLPLDPEARGRRPPLKTRPIRLGTGDEAAVVAVNNRAFVWHPDQADRTREWIHQFSAEPWFDAAGFLVHETDGVIDGFCWTKVHDEDPPLGEIFVIGVDPSAHGQGLGRGLTMAGLDYLSGRGIGIVMLYVEATNTAGLGLYDRLGFDRHQVKRAYQSRPPTSGHADSNQ